MGTSIEDLTARAKTLIAERRYQEAVRACRRVLLSRPDMVPVRLLLGMALLALRRHEEVRAEMMAVLRANPEEAAAHRLLGEAHLRAGQPHKARESLALALALDPSNDEARELLREVAEEEHPPSATIDRWFDPEAVATVQTDVPPLTEVPTGQIAVSPEAFGELPSVEVDPSLYAQAGAMSVADAEDDATVDQDHPFPEIAAPPMAPSGPRPMAHAPMRSAPRRSSFPPPPRSVPPAPGAAGPPRKSSFPPPSASVGMPQSFPPPPGMPTDPFDTDTAARSPHALRAPHDPENTHELDVGDMDRLENEALGGYPRGPADFPAAPQAAGFGHPQPPPQPYDDFPPPEHGGWAPEAAPYDPLDAMPTYARGPAGYDPAPAPQAPAPPYDPLEDERTRAREAPLPAFPNEAPGGGPLPPPPGFGAPMPGPHPQAAFPHPDPRGHSPPTPIMRAPARRLPKPALLAAVLVPILLIGVVVLIWSTVAESGAEEAIAAAAMVASDDGLSASLNAAIALAVEHDDDDPEDLALRAALLATATLEHGEDHREEVGRLLSLVEGEEAAAADTALAVAYLKLAAGDVDGAQAVLAGAPQGGRELLRARALAAQAEKGEGSLDRALPAAQAAVEERPGAPRHVALFALIMAQRRDVQAARTSLDNVPDGEHSPWIRVTRARILLESGTDPSGAADEARALLADLADKVTPAQAAWAHLVRARAALIRGELAEAVTEARAAATTRPGGDEDFGLRLAKIFLEAGEAEDASEVLGALPTQSQQPSRRAALIAEVAIDNGDIASAEQELEHAGASHHTLYLRGRVAEARGEDAQARELYEQAAADRDELVNAKGRLGAMELAAGHLEQAIEHFAEVVERQPADLEVVPLYVRALISAGEIDRAATVVNAALTVREGVPELLLAKAQVALARGAVEDAITQLRAIAEQRPEDPDVQVALGQAVRRGGQADDARAAFSRALELRENHPGALLGLAGLAVDSGDGAASEAAIARAREGGASGAELDREEARLMVLAGAGQRAVERLSALAESSSDPTLWVALGAAQRQAEQDDAARRSFERALSIDREQPEAHLGLAYLHVRRVRFSQAIAAINAATRYGETRGLGPAFQARVLAVRGRLVFEQGRFQTAEERAKEAVELDPQCAEAHLVLANLAEEDGEDPEPHFRAAVAGRAPPPEALGRLALRLRGGDACELARRYIEAAPRGYDASDVRGLLRRCP